MTPASRLAKAQRPLEGIKVLESSSFITGPYASMMLSDLGAQVIKVEPPSGDGFRSFGHKKNGWSALWSTANRDKSSIAIDLKTPDGIALMKELVAQADVLVENWRPRVAVDLGLGHDVVEQINPRLVRLSITGFGPTGPLAGAPAFDALFQAYTGMADLENPPDIAPYSVVDKVVSCFGAQAVLAALYQRERTGKGSRVSLAMLDVMAYFNFQDMFQHRTFLGDDSPPPSYYRPVVRTADGYIIVNPVSGIQYSRACKALGRPDIKAELLEIKDPTNMTQHFYSRIAATLATKPTAHWVEVFRIADIPAAPVCSRDEHLLDPQVIHNEIYHTVDSHAGPMRAPRYPATYNGLQLRPATGAPEVNEHAAAIREQVSSNQH